MNIKLIYPRLSCILLFCLANVATHAQNDRFPDYSVTHYNVSFNMNLDSIPYFSPDTLHELCPHVFFYELQGMPPVDDSTRQISVSGGTLSSENTNTPPAVLCRLLKAYNQQDLNAIKNLYAPQHRAWLDTITSTNADSITLARFNNYMQKMAFLSRFQWIFSWNMDSNVEAYED